MRDILEELLSLDSRLVRTVGPFLFQPGLLTAEYLAGRRTRYLPPFRLYLLCTAIYLAVAGLSGKSGLFDSEAEAIMRLVPKLMFVLLPVFVVLMKVLVDLSRLLVEHLVFALHFHAFAFFSFSASTLLFWVSKDTLDTGRATPFTFVALAIGSVLYLAPAVYLSAALGKVFGAGDFARTFALLGTYGTLLFLGTAWALDLMTHGWSIPP